MILADTSVWIDHLRQGNARLAELLEDDGVILHPWVIGELALGTLRDRKNFLSLLSYLPRLAALPDNRIMEFIEEHSIQGRGIGWIDAGILATCAARPCRILTLDRRLGEVAAALGLATA